VGDSIGYSVEVVANTRSNGVLRAEIATEDQIGPEPSMDKGLLGEETEPPRSTHDGAEEMHAEERPMRMSTGDGEDVVVLTPRGHSEGDDVEGISTPTNQSLILGPTIQGRRQ
jgi:hypothetical protein